MTIEAPHHPDASPSSHDLREAVIEWHIGRGLIRDEASFRTAALLAPTSPIAAELAWLAKDLKAAEDQNEALHVKLAALAPHGFCSCSYDKPDDVCAHHSPALAAAEARGRAEGRRDGIEETARVLEKDLASMTYKLTKFGEGAKATLQIALIDIRKLLANTPPGTASSV